MESKLIYSFFIILSFIIPSLLAFITNKSKRKHIGWLSLSALTFSILGGLLYTIVSSAINGNLQIGLSSYGGLIGLFAGALSYNHYYPIGNSKTVFKECLIYTPLIYSISKLACFHHGCCHGFEYHGLGNIYYTSLNNSYFPIQAIETIVFLIIFIALFINKDKKHIEPICVIVCAFAKLLLEPLREGYTFISPNTIIGIILICISICKLIYDVKKDSIILSS